MRSAPDKDPPSLILIRRQRRSHSHSLVLKKKKAMQVQVQVDVDAAGRYAFTPSLKWDPHVEAYFSHAYGASHFSRISSALTRPSSYSCLRVNTLKTSTHLVHSKLLQLLRHQHQHPPLISQNPALPDVLYVWGTGPHHPSYHPHPRPAAPLKEVIISRKCAEAVLRGAQIYVPGVMACSAHVEKGDKVAVSVAIEKPTHTGGWTLGITRGTVLHGTPSDIRYEDRHGLYIGEGVAFMSRTGIFRAKEGIAVEMTNRVYHLPSFNDVLEGEIFLQNLPSIVTARVLDPQPGEKILDMCAAPGGKTTAIAILMKDKGEVIALDRSHNKVMDILKLADEMEIKCIKAYKLDALKSVNMSITDENEVKSEEQSVIVDEECLDLTNLQKDEKGRYLSKAVMRKRMRQMRNGPGKNNSKGSKVANSKGFAPNSFDRVLLDAPCSALGLRPRLFAAEETVDSLRRHGTYQRRMFDRAVQLVRPGGVIVYSTCTINPGENEALVRYALDTYGFLTLAPQSPKIGGPGIVGSYRIDETHTEEWLKESEAELVQRFDPVSDMDTIGFFIAKFMVGMKREA
ncbi:S-adenosyl-L-methionine-dependent methyltransferases superfamily protein [Rhynchospora pubera]|uniref:S-adenosyl-L-methionine-dependent methyltransferases superfamily protein n=1 Tax=Rhynchospora pubera TaxID=906938 RepID=A0AAV8GWT3_9POAL|nr:S-adenosyl-L-methionine-dependent methyltransferases superfamily protein [Rhynchospora pubera]